MNPWLQFLADHPAAPASALSGEDGMFTPLTELGLIAASGDEAASFLHSQLTNDVSHLNERTARLAGYCSPKGRLLATFLVWKRGETIFLQLPRELQAPIQKRLQMFVLRAKVKLSDATPDHALIGLAGAGAETFLQPRFGKLPSAPFDVASADAGVLIRLPGVSGTSSASRFQWITSPESAVAAWPDLERAMKRADAAAWRRMDIEAGIPQILPATQEQFVPQMINFELVGGVNFKKGCYPGQEIVARSQYLGKLKRRMCLASVETPDVAPGTEVFSEADPSQPCGMVVNAEPAGAKVSDCLVELKLAAQAAGNVHLGSADGPVLRFRALPYALTDPV
jgi:folate-binding protein YgfZ